MMIHKVSEAEDHLLRVWGYTKSEEMDTYTKYCGLGMFVYKDYCLRFVFRSLEGDITVWKRDNLDPNEENPLNFLPYLEGWLFHTFAPPIKPLALENIKT